MLPTAQCRPRRCGHTRDARVTPPQHPSQSDFHPVVRRAYTQRLVVAARDLREATRLGEDAVDRFVAVHRLMMEQAQLAGLSRVAELDADDVARVAPVGL